MTKTVVFDFDGVLVLDSDGIFKQEAWQRILWPYRGRYEPLLQAAKNTYGSGKSGGREEIFAYVYRNLGISESEISRLTSFASRQFDDYVQMRIRHSGLAPGARELIEELWDVGLLLYVNSGTPDDALRSSAQGLNIQHYFKGLLGSSRSKVANFGFILTRFGDKCFFGFVIRFG